jgi:hypothetical protein
MAWHALVKENICKRTERLKQVIRTHTGLSPAMFFALFAVVTTTAAASIAILSSFVSPPTHADPEKKPGARDPDDTGIFPEPVQVGEITDDELRMYDGSDPEKPILTAIKGQIYDVSKSRFVYLDPWYHISVLQIFVAIPFHFSFFFVFIRIVVAVPIEGCQTITRPGNAREIDLLFFIIIFYYIFSLYKIFIA